jgi:hypothetical protein
LSKKIRCFVAKCDRHLGSKIQVNFDKKIHKLDNNIPINIRECFFSQKVVFIFSFFIIFRRGFAENQQLSGGLKKHVGLKWLKFSSQMLVSDWLLTTS